MTSQLLDADYFYSMLTQNPEVARLLPPAAAEPLKRQIAWLIRNLREDLKGEAAIAPLREAIAQAAPAGEPIVIHTDGSCLGNPGPGGWACVFSDGFTVVGNAADTTNNRMEIAAAIGALEELERAGVPPTVEVEIRTDSKLVVKTMQGEWSAATNHDLWSRLKPLAAKRRVTWTWVRGHNGDPQNERANQLAQEQAAYRKGM